MRLEWGFLFVMSSENSETFRFRVFGVWKFGLGCSSYVNDFPQLFWLKVQWFVYMWAGPHAGMAVCKLLLWSELECTKNE